MKTKYLFGLTLLALAGCTADVEVHAPVPTPDGVFSINLTGDISQEYLTRVDDGGFCDGDQIGLYGVNYSNDNADKGTLYDEGNQVDNAKYTYDEANNSWSSSGSVYYKDAETNIDLYGYTPMLIRRVSRPTSSRLSRTRPTMVVMLHRISCGARLRTSHRASSV